mmetsp:Transcript_34450/g.83360  ORF Transcript_34450/g.83360 Transcript_34450/m.83360 type:complete len:475 (-) Transcript_34450:217-1641(-)
MSTPRSYPKRNRQSTGAGTYSTARRPRRSAGTGRAASGASGGVGGGVVVSTENLGVAAQKWTKVYRAPVAPLDEPYFGSSASASFEIPMWVKLDELTPEERSNYDEEDKKREAQRAIWRRELAEKAAAEEEAAKNKAEKEIQEGKDGDKGKNNDDNNGAEVGDEPEGSQDEEHIGDSATEPVATSGGCSKDEAKSEPSGEVVALDNEITPDIFSGKSQGEVHASNEEAPKNEEVAAADDDTPIAPDHDAELQIDELTSVEKPMDVEQTGGANKDEEEVQEEKTVAVKEASSLKEEMLDEPSVSIDDTAISVSQKDGIKEEGSSEKDISLDESDVEMEETLGPKNEESVEMCATFPDPENDVEEETDTPNTGDQQIDIEQVGDSDKKEVQTSSNEEVLDESSVSTDDDTAPEKTQEDGIEEERSNEESIALEKAAIEMEETSVLEVEATTETPATPAADSAEAGEDSARAQHQYE